jgi:hypothetical protein
VGLAILVFGREAWVWFTNGIEKAISIRRGFPVEHNMPGFYGVDENVKDRTCYLEDGNSKLGPLLCSCANVGIIHKLSGSLRVKEAVGKPNQVGINVVK